MTNISVAVWNGCDGKYSQRQQVTGRPQRGQVCRDVDATPSVARAPSGIARIHVPKVAKTSSFAFALPFAHAPYLPLTLHKVNTCLTAGNQELVVVKKDVVGDDSKEGW